MDDQDDNGEELQPLPPCVERYLEGYAHGVQDGFNLAKRHSGDGAQTTTPSGTQ